MSLMCIYPMLFSGVLFDNLSLFVFTVLIEYHIHPGTLHAGSLEKPGSLTTLYSRHYIGLTLDPNSMCLFTYHAMSISMHTEIAKHVTVHVASSVLQGRSLPKIQCTQLLERGRCIYAYISKKGAFANSEVQDETLQNLASHQCLRYLPC